MPRKTKNLRLKTKKVSSFTVPVYSLAGREIKKMSLPKGIFGVKVNQALLTQAIRVYLANQKTHFSHTKTRAEVKGSTRKIQRQKGTGRARHGAIRAPIFVGGGIALGPKYRKVILNLPQKMKKAALISALSSKAEEKAVLGFAGFQKASGKTKEIETFLKKINKKNVLFLEDGKNEKFCRAARNLPGVEILPVDDLNALEVLKYQTLMFTKEAVEKLDSRMMKKELKEK
jgi:large subunit ribosomal protein L4